MKRVFSTKDRLVNIGEIMERFHKLKTKIYLYLKQVALDKLYNDGVYIPSFWQNMFGIESGAPLVFEAVP